MKKRIYEKKVIETVARLWVDSYSMASISRELDIPYKTIVYWVNRLRIKGLKRKIQRTEREKDFEEIVNDVLSE